MENKVLRKPIKIINTDTNSMILNKMETINTLNSLQLILNKVMKEADETIYRHKKVEADICTHCTCKYPHDKIHDLLTVLTNMEPQLVENAIEILKYYLDDNYTWYDKVLTKEVSKKLNIISFYGSIYDTCINLIHDLYRSRSNYKSSDSWNRLQENNYKEDNIETLTIAPLINTIYKASNNLSLLYNISFCINRLILANIDLWKEDQILLCFKVVELCFWLITFYKDQATILISSLDIDIPVIRYF